MPAVSRPTIRTGDRLRLQRRIDAADAPFREKCRARCAAYQSLAVRPLEDTLARGQGSRNCHAARHSRGAARSQGRDVRGSCRAVGGRGGGRNHSHGRTRGTGRGGGRGPMGCERGWPKRRPWPAKPTFAPTRPVRRPKQHRERAETIVRAEGAWKARGACAAPWMAGGGGEGTILGRNGLRRARRSAGRVARFGRPQPVGPRPVPLFRQADINPTGLLLTDAATRSSCVASPLLHR
jgi:hypothetical protein